MSFVLTLPWAPAPLWVRKARGQAVALSWDLLFLKAGPASAHHAVLLPCTPRAFCSLLQTAINLL